MEILNQNECSNDIIDFEIIQSCYQTKTWRKNCTWYNNGKSNECEKYQIYLIEKIIFTKLKKTDDRLDIENIEIKNIKNPLTYECGFNFTENFDGLIDSKDKTYYFNLKFVCDSGGAQIRTLREVYHFIKYQMEYLIKNMKNNNIQFFNILDGDTCYKNINKFNYLLDKERYKNIKDSIFIGSLYDFNNIIKSGGIHFV
jgi:hypothetical protein